MKQFHKWTATALAAALGASLALPASAVESMDQRLSQVTQIVKETLNIGDHYTQFHGEPEETPLGTEWTLYWADEEENLNVTATNEGKVLRYDFNDSGSSTESWGNQFGPSFPPLSQSAARQTAKDFVNRLLTDGETAVFEEDRESGKSLGITRYGFGGNIQLNGIPTPMSFRVWVDTETGEISSFWRNDESSYIGDIPAPSTVTTAEKAKALLRDTLDFELLYVLDGKRAVLRYVPKSTDNYYVDAASGSLVNLTELQTKLDSEDKRLENGINGAGGASPSADSAAPEASFSPAELEGIAKLEGVLDKDRLDTEVRKWNRFLKLDGFELSTCTYSMPKEQTANPVERDEETDSEPDVIARLSYTKKAGDSVRRRIVTVDAFNGALQSMYGYNPYQENTAVTCKEEEAQKIAASFVSEFVPAQAEVSELYDSRPTERASDSHRFTFSQKVNGYFFPENYITVQVSADDGSVLGFSKNYDTGVSFDSADGLVSADTAAAAWADLYPVTLAYIEVPVDLKLMGEEAMPLLNVGWSYYCTLKPGYAFGQPDGYYTGVDAKTGKAVKEKGGEVNQMTYDDLNGHWAKTAMEELAEYRVGWFGGKADPDAPVTQLAYLALLASADGYEYTPNPDNPETSVNALYDYVVRRGLIQRDERDEEKIMTRGEAVRLLLDSLGYRTVAHLDNIFRCDYADAESIAAELKGYAALAQGLGIVKGDSAGNFAASRTSSRAEAAVMLWQYMKR